MIPKISVVIPLYNKEKYIENAINSVLSQTVTEFEIYVVNDGSSDNGPNLVKSYSDSRIHLINQENQGVSVARNHGVELARTNIVAFLDADDTWNANFLETILKLHNKFPNAGLYATGTALWLNGEIIKEDIFPPADSDGRLLDTYFTEFLKAGHSILQTSACAVSKEAFQKIGGFSKEFRVGQDQELFGRMALYYDFAYVPIVCSNYTLAAENNADKVKHYLPIPFTVELDSYFNREESINHRREDVEHYIDYWNLRIGARNIYSGYRREGRRQLSSVILKQHCVKKYLFMLLSYVPINFSKISPMTVRKILHMIHLW